MDPKGLVVVTERDLHLKDLKYWYKERVWDAST
jgi:hypothetical protein